MIRIARIVVQAMPGGGFKAEIKTKDGQRILVPLKPTAAEMRSGLEYLAAKLDFPLRHVPTIDEMEQLSAIAGDRGDGQ